MKKPKKIETMTPEEKQAANDIRKEIHRECMRLMNLYADKVIPIETRMLMLEQNHSYLQAYATATQERGILTPLNTIYDVIEKVNRCWMALERRAVKGDKDLLLIDTTPEDREAKRSRLTSVN